MKRLVERRVRRPACCFTRQKFNKANQSENRAHVQIHFKKIEFPFGARTRSRASCLASWLILKGMESTHSSLIFSWRLDFP